MLDAGDAADAADGTTVRSALYAQVVLADNPLGYWRFEETAGTMAKDETARIDGVYTNQPALGAPGVAGSRAAKLPKGTNARVDVASPAFHFPGSAPHSIEVWVQPGEVKDYQFFASTEIALASTKRTGWSLLAGADGTARYEAWVPNVDGGGGGQVRGVILASRLLTPGSFHHVVSTYDGTTIVGYFDGVRGTTQSAPNAAGSGGSLAWGCRPDTTYCFDDWVIDEVAIYVVVLPSARVKAHYDLGK